MVSVPCCGHATTATVRGVTSSGLVEREAELRALADAVERGTSGTGGMVVVEGPAGIGKSRLLEAVAVHATEAGARVLRARGGILERDVAYGAVRHVPLQDLSLIHISEPTRPY